jgi:hypothetical protein
VSGLDGREWCVSVELRWMETLAMEEGGAAAEAPTEERVEAATEEIVPSPLVENIPVAQEIRSEQQPPKQTVNTEIPTLALDAAPPIQDLSLSPTLKQDPKNKRHSYKDVESRLHQSTAATNNGKWQGPASPTQSRKQAIVGTPFVEPPAGAGESNHTTTFETPSSTERSYFKDIPSRLHETTVATSNGKWAKGHTESEKSDLPKFNTSVRRASLGELIVPQEKDKSTWKDPYKDTIQSRLFSPTIATTQGQWKDHASATSEATPMDSPTPSSPTEKSRRRYSTTFVTTDLSSLVQELPTSGKASPYDSVKTRLHLQTAAVKNAKWAGEKPSELSSPEPQRFVSTFSKRASEFPPPSPPVPSSANSEYKDVKSRIFESTTAMDHGKYAGPEVSLDSSLPKFDTSVRRSSGTASDFDSPPPLPLSENRKYRNVQSRLHTPTTASKEAAWKKESAEVCRLSLFLCPNCPLSLLGS